MPPLFVIAPKVNHILQVIQERNKSVLFCFVPLELINSHIEIILTALNYHVSTSQRPGS